MCIFQSEQVIIGEGGMSWFHRKKRMATEFARSQAIGLSCVGNVAGMLSEMHPQNCPTLPSWRLPCYRYGMICHRSSLIRQSRHFEWDFDRVLLQLVDIFLHSFNTEKAAVIRRWNVETVDEKFCVVWFVITEYSGRATPCLLEKVNFKL